VNARRGLLAAAFGLLLALPLLVGCGKREVATSGAASGTADAAFSILAGSEVKEIAPAIEAAAKAAGVSVKFTYAGTLDMAERINGGERHDALLPANGAYVGLALSTPPLAREKLFYSRIALGVKPAKAAALGWDREAPTWADVARAAGKGQWRYAMTNPTASNTGMSALFAVASAVAGKSEDLKVEEVDAKLLKDFLSGQALTAGSSGWLAEAYLRESARLDGMVNYEAVILQTNAKLPAAEQLRLVYPRDGQISADYPLLLLTEARRADHGKLVQALKSLDFQRQALPAAFLRPSHPDAPAAGALPGIVVPELAFPNRLAVIDAVLDAYQGEWRRPATSILVLDVSGSMEGQRLEAMRDALIVLGGADPKRTSQRFARFQNRERVVLITFSSNVNPAQWVRFDQGDVDAARSAVRRFAEGLAVEGGTAVYSALAEAQRIGAEERRRDPDRLVSILLLTDGESNEGLRFGDFKAALAGRTDTVRVFPILFGEGNVAEMNEIASLTGGRVFDSRNAALSAVFKDIRGYQ
jgi:Ca-activated chloride channel family protein